MSKFLRPGLFAIALTFVFNAFAVTETKAQVILNEVLKRMEAHRTALKTMESNVTFVKKDSLIDVEDTREGIVKYIPGRTEKEMYIRIDWTKPEEKIAVTKTTYKLYQPNLKQVIIGEVSKAKNSANTGNVLGFMSMSKAQLKANYSYKYIGEATLSTGAKTVHLELLPKKAQNYKSAELWVDVDGMPLQMKINEKNGDSTTVLLKNIKKNATINTSDFEIETPKGTKVIKG